MRILITSPHPLLTQAVVNVLGGRGHELHIADPKTGGLADRYGITQWPSRWVDARHEVHSSPTDPDNWARELATLISAHAIDTVLPLGNHLGALARSDAHQQLAKAWPALPSATALAQLEHKSFLANLGLPTAPLTPASSTDSTISGMAQLLFSNAKPQLVHASVVRKAWQPGYPAASTTMTIGHPDILDAASTIGTALSWEGPLTLGLTASYDGDYSTFSYEYALAELGDPSNAALANLDLPSRWIALSRPDLLAFDASASDQLRREARSTSFAGLGSIPQLHADGTASPRVGTGHAFILLDGPRWWLRIARALRLGAFRGSTEVLTPWRTDLATRKFYRVPRP